MECGKSLVRSEGFMDLNLPIVRRQRDTKDTNKSNGCNKMGDDVSALKYGDTDVQYLCFDAVLVFNTTETDDRC